MKRTTKEIELISRAMERYRDCADAWSRIHSEGRDDDKFISGEQWPEALKNKRESKLRPCHVINKLRTTCRRVVNENRRNRPMITLRAVDDMADVEIVEVKNGLVKHILYNSDAETAFDTALEHAVFHGFGWVRVVTDYAHEKTFEQEIKVERIADAYSVLVPIHLCKDFLFSDAPYAFVVKDMSRDEFDIKYPGKYSQSWETQEAKRDNWISEKNIRVCEYFEREDETKTIWLLDDGSISEIKPEEEKRIVKSRETVISTWKWYLLTAGAILDETEWPGRYLPLVPVLGEVMNIDGETRLFSLTRFGRDPQQIFNYWRSCETEMIALAPKAPFIGARGQFEGYERIWARANTDNIAYLEYNAIVDATGQAVLPPPRRVDMPQIPTAYVNAAKEAADDIKAVTGIFDASLGAQGNETSGRAILSRQAQADIVNFHFADNYAKALRQVGRVIVDLIPSIYDTARTIVILGEDKAEKVVRVNQIIEEGGKRRFLDMSGGKYDLIVDIGPAYQSKREEATANMIELIRAFPQFAQIMGDLIVENMDFPGASEIADRIRKTIPPQLLQKTGEEKQPTRQEVMQLLSDMQKLEVALNEAAAALKDKSADRAIEIDKALLQSETAILIEKIRQGGNVDIDILRAMRERISPSPAMPTGEQAQLPGQAPAARQPQEQMG